LAWDVIKEIVRPLYPNKSGEVMGTRKSLEDARVLVSPILCADKFNDLLIDSVKTFQEKQMEKKELERLKRIRETWATNLEKNGVQERKSEFFTRPRSR